MGDDRSRRIYRIPDSERRATEVQLAILEELVLLRKEIRHMQQQIQDQLDQLQQQVSAETEVEQSAVTLLTGLHQQLEDALANAGTDDPSDVVAAIQGISQQLKTDTDALAAAVAANTPAASGNSSGSDTGSSSSSTGTDTSGSSDTSGTSGSSDTGTSSGDATDPTA